MAICGRLADRLYGLFLSCPANPHRLVQAHLVPEMYRHSIGILDTAGNLVAHLGRYGNLDDLQKVKEGGTELPLTFVRFVSSTDNHLVFDDFNDRLVVQKLGYHAEATVGMGPGEK